MTLRPDLQIIADLVKENARVLDLGCGEGELLAHLQLNKNVNGYGLDVDPGNIRTCLARVLTSSSRTWTKAWQIFRTTASTWW